MRSYLVYVIGDAKNPWSRHRTLRAARREARNLLGGARIWMEYTNRREVPVKPHRRSRFVAYRNEFQSTESSSDTGANQ